MAGAGRWRAAAATIVVVAVLTGWTSALAGGASPSAPAGSGLSRPSVKAATRARGTPTTRPSHLIVVVEENRAFEQLVGSRVAPFLNHLAARGTLLTGYHAITHPSLPTYLALLSGRTGRIRSDCVRCTITGPTLIDQLEARRISWAAYLQGLPRPCSAVARSGAYTEAVDPFMHAARVRDRPSRCDRVLPFRRFHADLAAGRLPRVVFVMPDLRHEMHSGSVRVADAWLHRLVGALHASPVWRQDTRLVVTFDESNRHDARSCCDGLARGGRGATVGRDGVGGEAGGDGAVLIRMPAGRLVVHILHGAPMNLEAWLLPGMARG
jgi:phosphatidylinositol-3-phosphatase